MGLWNISILSILLVLASLYFAVGAQFSFFASDNYALGAVAGSLVYGAPKSTLATLIKYGVVACCVTVAWLGGRSILDRLSTCRLLTFLILLSTLSVFWSQDPKTTMIESISLWITYVFAMAFSVLPEERQARIIEWTGVMAISATAIMVLYYPQYGYNHRQNNNEWQGIFSGKNVCAMEIVFLLMPALFRFGSGARWFRSLYVVSALLTIANTGSRTGWSISVLLLGWAAFLRFARKLDQLGRTLLYACGVFSLGCLIAYVWRCQTFVFTLMGKDSSLTGRTAIWNAVWLSIMKAPLLGYGYRAFWQGMQGESANVLQNIGWVMGYAHNGFLGLWLELGGVGLAIFLVSLLIAIRNGIFCIIRDCSSSTCWYLTIVLFTVLYNIDEATVMYRFQLIWMLYVVAWVGLDRKRTMLLSAGTLHSDSDTGSVDIRRDAA